MLKKIWLGAAVSILNACGGGGSGDGPLISQPTPAKVGRFLYVPNSESSDISAFTINSSTGTLTSVSGSPFASSVAGSILAHPSGRFLYSSHAVLTNPLLDPPKLAGFSIDTSTGALISVPNSPYTFPGVNNSSAFLGVPQFHPSGNFLYWGSVFDSGAYSYAVSATTGELTSPTPQPGSSGVFDSSGQHYYVSVNSPSAAVNVYTVNGATGARTLSSTQATGQNLNGVLALHPSGKSLYVASTDPRSIAGFSIDASTGNLTALPGSPFAVGGSANSIGFALKFSQSGKFTYLLDSNITINLSTNGPTPIYGPAAIYGFTVDLATGVLVSIASSPYATGGVNPSSFQTYPDDGHLVVTNGVPSYACSSQCSPSIAIFGVNSETGALTPVTGSPFAPPGTMPGSLILDVSGKFAYLTDSGSNTVTAFSVRAADGTLTAVGTYPIGTGSLTPIIIGEQ